MNTIFTNQGAMSLDVVIRKFVPEDVNNLIALVDESQPEALAEDKEASRQCLLDYTSNPDSTTYFLAEMNGKLIGYIEGLPLNDLDEGDPLVEYINDLGESDPLVEYMKNAGELYYCQMIFVSASQRMKGISKVLYKTIMDYALEQGYKGIITSVPEDNEPSLSLHRSFRMKEETFRDGLKIFSMDL